MSRQTSTIYGTHNSVDEDWYKVQFQFNGKVAEVAIGTGHISLYG